MKYAWKDAGSIKNPLTSLGLDPLDDELGGEIENSFFNGDYVMEHYYVSAGQIYRKTENEINEINKKVIQIDNKTKIKDLQDDYIGMIIENENRIKCGLPGNLPQNVINNLKSILQELQQLYDSPPSNPDFEISTGPVYPDWEPTENYTIGDVVYHNNVMWRATSNNSNNPPDDVPGDWEQME